jgi:TolB-like protein/class 3 adenylate cyclase
VERRLTAVFAGDVAGYSRLMGADEEGTLARLNTHWREFLGPSIAENRGRIVKRTGDGVLIEFVSAVYAARCAVQIQRGMTLRNADVPVDKRIEFRIGIHVGDIIIEDRDIFGDGVNIAARLEGIAVPGGICISEDAYRQVRGKLDATIEDGGSQQLKNIAWPVRVYRVRHDVMIGTATPDDPGSTSTANGILSTERPSMLIETLAQLWRSIKERKIVQWSIAYVALAYGMQHGVVLTGDAFAWPHPIQQISMLLLAVGLPVVMTFAWYHGERASPRISGPELTIISILLVIGSLFFYVLVRPAEKPIASRARPVVQQAGVTATRNATTDPHGAVSIAVLPFVNLSSDKEQEFFSDGMTEEIITALAKIADLRVVARESALQYKGEKNDLRTIGRALGATHLITGSVRKMGGRVRITAQLVKADGGVNIWADSYDREIMDVFTVQEDIARAITTSLRGPLGLKARENLVNNRSINPESYQQYLRAKALVRSLGGEHDFCKRPRFWNRLSPTIRISLPPGRYWE